MIPHPFNQARPAHFLLMPSVVHGFTRRQQNNGGRHLIRTAEAYLASSSRVVISLQSARILLYPHATLWRFASAVERASENPRVINTLGAANDSPIFSCNPVAVARCCYLSRVTFHHRSKQATNKPSTALDSVSETSFQTRWAMMALEKIITPTQETMKMGDVIETAIKLRCSAHLVTAI
jgi:hypothetical protein